MPDPSLIFIFDVVTIGLQYTLLVECPDFGLKCLVTVMPKVSHQQSTVVHVLASKIDRNYNSLLRPADSDGVIIVKLKKE